ncbi:MAG: hypothetical protein OEZ52_14585 [Candidatus Aminicenantes bacterium]|nr:hypothetical protein [Candidatus Aminicenantes bacterium]
MDTKMCTKKKALSPVISTVILVAVAITVAVAVAYWMSGIAGQYTKFEKVEIQTGYSEKVIDLTDPLNPVFEGWQVTLELKNTGSATSTLIRVFVNDIAIPELNYEMTTADWLLDDLSTSLVYDGTSIGSGETVTVYIYIDEAFGTLSSGTTVNIKIHSAAGMDYIKLVSLV